MTARLNQAMISAVARHPGVTPAGSFCASAEPDRPAVVSAPTGADLRVDADVIVVDGERRSVDVDLVRPLAAIRLDVCLTTERPQELPDGVCRERDDRITFPLEGCSDVQAATVQIRASPSHPVPTRPTFCPGCRTSTAC